MTPTDLALEAEQHTRRLQYSEADFSRLRDLLIGDWRAERDARDQEQRVARQNQTLGR